MSSHLRNTIILRGIDFYTPRMRKITQKRQGRKTDLKPNKKMLTDKKSANEMIAEKLNTNVGKVKKGKLIIEDSRYINDVLELKLTINGASNLIKSVEEPKKIAVCEVLVNSHLKLQDYENLKLS